MKSALICGISGQDGAYLARLLLSKGYAVWGTSRDAQVANVSNLVRLGISENIRLLSMAPSDFRSVLTSISKAEPNEVYFLAGQSSVGLSFEQPVETMESITQGTLNLLEALRFFGGNTRFYHASSSESFRRDTHQGRAQRSKLPSVRVAHTVWRKHPHTGSSAITAKPTD